MRAGHAPPPASPPNHPAGRHLLSGLPRLAAIVLAALALGVDAGAEPASPARSRLGPLAERPRGGGRPVLKLEAPVVRIGLGGDGRTLQLESDGGLHVVDRESGKDSWKHVHRGSLRFVLERGGGDPAETFRVQVASLASQDEAEQLEERLEAETGEVADVTRNPDRNSWRVRVGQRASREEIRQVEEKVRGMGFAEIWVVREPGPAGREAKIRLVDQDYNDMLVASRALLVVPAAEGRPIKVADQPYRGAIEVLITRGRELQAVNVLNLEEYLRGVVPKEMGPSVFPELEALKAQAVAARTYVAANTGQFSEEGFDICDSARCQVYGGMLAEHPLTDFAVQQTAGLVLTHEGAPINALYTSTCGGHTEDIANVFREMTGPYLKGVPCYAESAGLAAGRRTLRGLWDGTPITLAGGERLEEAAALLEVLGILTPEEATARHLAGFPTPDEISAWTGRALRAAGKKGSSGEDLAAGAGDLSALALHLARAFDWGDRIALLLSPDDLQPLLGERALAATPEPARKALAYMTREGILPPPAVSQPVSRAMLARALHRMILRYDSAALKPAKFRGSRGESLGVQAEGVLEFFPLASRLHLFLRSDAGPVPLPDLVLQEGDNLEYHLSGAGSIDFIAVKPGQRGGSDDRFSNLYLWEARVAREELETRIRSRASIGRLVDVLPGRRGASGRILDLTVVGSSGRFTFHGFNIERLLGLRETLFLVDRQYGADGKVATFVFTGKGWGHGVGMCQVGSYGMALRGMSHEEILRHYYSGATLQRWPAAP